LGPIGDINSAVGRIASEGNEAKAIKVRNAVPPALTNCRVEKQNRGEEPREHR